VTRDKFEQVVQASVSETISKTLGAEVWKSIQFYFDFKTMASDPDTFARVMDKLFGRASKPLKQVIGQSLVARVTGQPDVRKDREFVEWFQIARAKFHASSSFPA
jgi:hypothetical protein